MFKRKNRKPNQEDLCSFFRIVRRYSIANMPIWDALNDYLKDCDKEKMKEIIASISINMKNGMGFSEALKKHTLFPSFAVEMIRIGESTGQLPAMLEEIVFYFEQNIDIQRKLTAGLFPVKFFLMGAVTAMLVAIFLVLPTFRDILTDLHAELPIVTQLVMSFGDLMSSCWPLFVVLGFMSFFGYKWVKRVHPGKIDKVKLKMPFYREIYLNLIWYRFSKVLALVCRNNVTPAEALRYAAIAVDNAQMKEVLLSASKKINSSGLGTVDALKHADKDQHLLTKTIFMMLHAGEASGNISKLMGDLAEDYRKDLLVASANIGEKVGMSIIIPTFVGLFIILGSVYMPIFSMMSAGTGMQ